MKSCTFWTDVSLPDVLTADEVKFTLFWFSLSDAQGWQRDKNSQKIIKKLSEHLSLRVQTRPRDTFSHSDLSLKRPRRPPPSPPIQAAFRSSRTSSSCRPCPRCFYASRQRLQAGKNEENSSTPQTETKHFIFFMLEPITFKICGWINWNKAKYVQTIKTKLIWKLNETKLTKTK